MEGFKDFAKIDSIELSVTFQALLACPFAQSLFAFVSRTCRMFDISRESILAKFVKRCCWGGYAVDHPSYSLIRLAWRFTTSLPPWTDPRGNEGESKTLQFLMPAAFLIGAAA